KLVDRAGEADGVLGPLPGGALETGAERQAAVDIGEGPGLAAPVVPAQPREDAEIVAHRLLEIDGESRLPARAAHGGDIGRRAGLVCQRHGLREIAHGGAVGEDEEAQLAWPSVDLVPRLELA